MGFEMIKNVINYEGIPYYTIKCDSCHIQIASCSDFQFQEGQELVYSPLLCEECGTRYNKELGIKQQIIDKLEKEINELKKENLK